MTRRQKIVGVTVMVSCYLLFSAWILNRRDHTAAKETPLMPEAEKATIDRATPAVSAGQDLSKSDRETLSNTEAGRAILAMQDRFRNNLDAIDSLGKEDIELNGVLENAESRLEQLKAPEYSDQEREAEVISPLVRMRGGIVRRRDIKLNIIRLLEEQEDILRQKEQMLGSPEDDVERDKPKLQASEDFKSRMEKSVAACNTVLDRIDQLAEQLTRQH